MRTHEEIYNSMKEKYAELTGIVPWEESDINLRMRILSGEIYSALCNAQWLKRQMFPDTAEGEYLEKHALERGLVRREAGFASGEVTFSVSEALDFPVEIEKGTVVGTGGEQPQRFETVESCTLETGETEVSVRVIALRAGREGNVMRHKVNVLVTPPAYIESVRNEKAFTGGADKESDMSLRERIAESFLNVSNGTNCAYYKKMATMVSGVASASVVPRGRGVGTVDVYIASQNSEASDSQVQSVQDLLSKLREVNVDVKVMKAQPRNVRLAPDIVLKEGYEFEEVSRKCEEALHDYVSTRGVGSNVLLTEIGEILHHIEGVKQYSLSSVVNANVICEPYEYPVPLEIRVLEGEEL